MEKYINNPKQGSLQKVTIKKTACHRSSFLWFKKVVSCSNPEWISIKQSFLAIYGNLSYFKQKNANKNTQGVHISQKQSQVTLV